jgi:arylsulfatase
MTPCFAVWTIALICATSHAWAQSPPAGGAAKPPYNIIFIISDQEADHSAQSADIHANRPGVLFNYVGIQTIDGNYLLAANKDVFGGKPLPSLAEMHPDLSKRGFLFFVFDGRYKFARYYAPAAFNVPQTLDQIFKYNDVQLFDLSEDPDELHNLAQEPEKYKDTILRMNTLLNELMAKEVGKNDGSFLPAAVRPKQTVVFDKQ